MSLVGERTREKWFVASRMFKSGDNPAIHHGGLYVQEYVWVQMPKSQGIKIGKCVVIFTHSLVDSGKTI